MTRPDQRFGPCMLAGCAWAAILLLPAGLVLLALAVILS